YLPARVRRQLYASSLQRTPSVDPAVAQRAGGTTGSRYVLPGKSAGNSKPEMDRQGRPGSRRRPIGHATRRTRSGDVATAIGTLARDPKSIIDADSACETGEHAIFTPR